MTRLPAFVLAVIVAVAVAGGIGVYLAVRGVSTPSIPKAKQSPVLEEAKAEGIISGYRVVPGPYGTWGYEVNGGEISLKFPNACGYRSCPDNPPVIRIDYRHTAAAQARAILKITRRWAQRTYAPPTVSGPPDYRWHRQGVGYRIIFDPPYYP